jgi:hypothetical protein
MLYLPRGPGMPGCSLRLHQALTLTDVVTDAVLDAAFAWFCHQLQDWPAEADVWRFRQHWPEEKAQLQADLLGGTYEVGLLSRVTLQHGEEVDLWPARDAVVMKALALVLPEHLPALIMASAPPTASVPGKHLSTRGKGHSRTLASY